MERNKKLKKGDEISMEFILNKPPYISNKFKINNLDRFFYEYADFKKINITDLDISQKDLDLKLNMIHQKFFKEEILDTISVVDSKNLLVELKNYNLKNKKIKIPEHIFGFFEHNHSISGKITLEFDKIRDFFYISKFEKWDFNFSLENYFYPTFDFRLLLKSLGYNEQNLLFREKISLIARLLPCVEKNINIVEITKPQVGKSFIYDELMTDSSIVKKANDLTPTNLFSPINSNFESEAILKNYPILCIDEFHKGDLKDIVAGLQTFMENGKVSRGKKSYHSDTSIIMFANFKKEHSYKKIFINPKEINPFKNIHGIDKAFLERIDYINPSFGMRTLNESMFLNESIPRIPTSIYQDIFDNLRNIEVDFKKIFPNIKIYNNNTETDTRTTKSIFKTASGFLKLLFPNILNSIIRNPTLTSESYTHLYYCFYLAMEGNSFLNVLTQNNSKNLVVKLDASKQITLGDSIMYQNMIEYFLGFNFPFLNGIYLFDSISPHRYVYHSHINGNPTFVKIPLDTFGIEENTQENSIYNYFPNHSKIDNNKLEVFQFYVNNFSFNGTQIRINNQPIPSNFIDFRYRNKNYLFGYDLLYQNMQSQYFNTTNLGRLFPVNTPNVSCPNCKCEFPLFMPNQNYYHFNNSWSCPKCKNESFPYDLFPQYFEDYKG